jgi:hypothetical protein
MNRIALQFRHLVDMHLDEESEQPVVKIVEVGEQQMNRKQRRAAAADSRKSRQNSFYHSYLTHLPKVDRPELTPGGITHVVFFHDDWCDIYTNSRTCTCNPDVECRVEP